MTTRLKRTHASRRPPCGRPLTGQSPTRLVDRNRLNEMNRQLSDYVLSKKLNQSDARSKIIEALARQEAHFRAQDLVNTLAKMHPEVGRATVYRNLPLFVASGLIQEGPTDPAGEVLYELSDRHHDHIVCRDCHRIFEFHDAPLEQRQDQIAQNLSFSVTGHRHVIYGSCTFLKRAKLAPNKGRLT